MKITTYICYFDEDGYVSRVSEKDTYECDDNSPIELALISMQAMAMVVTDEDYQVMFSIDENEETLH